MKKMLLLTIVLLSLGCGSEVDTMRESVELEASTHMSASSGQKVECKLFRIKENDNGWTGNVSCYMGTLLSKTDLKINKDYTFYVYKESIQIFEDGVKVHP